MTQAYIAAALAALESDVVNAVPFYARGIVRTALANLSPSERERLARGYVAASTAHRANDAVAFYGACEDAGLGLLSRHLWRYLGG